MHPIRHIKKEDGKLAEVEEVLPFKVLEFDRDDKRIIVSHTRVSEDAKLEEKEIGRGEKKKKLKKKEAFQTNNKVEKICFR